jgi:hypothetical protein
MADKDCPLFVSKFHHRWMTHQQSDLLRACNAVLAPAAAYTSGFKRQPFRWEGAAAVAFCG